MENPPVTQQAWQINRDSRSDRRTSSGHLSPLIAAIIRAIDQETANASGAHLGKGDLLAGEWGHAPFKRDQIAKTIR
jgi:hypothetical protein